ncbi:MAG TPA: hypothetical protein VFF06_37355 [Polyangia bacterium]|nr:hypothetical protein [Polyangia bacterium]
MAEDDKKNTGEDANQPPSEEQLATQERDPDEAVFAEQAILEYAAWVLDQFQQNTQLALDNLTAWVQGQTETATFNDAGFFDQAGKSFMDQMMSACGGSDSPIGQTVFAQLDGAIDQAVRDESEASLFIEQLSRGVRDIAWYLRDNLQSVLAGQWDQLRDLAYEGSTEFIPVLHGFGLPTAEMNPADLSTQLTSVAQAYAAAAPKKQEKVEEEAPKEETAEAEEKEEEAESAQQEFQEEKEAGA